MKSNMIVYFDKVVYLASVINKNVYFWVVHVEDVQMINKRKHLRNVPQRKG